jgi:hypothetical protein
MDASNTTVADHVPVSWKATFASPFNVSVVDVVPVCEPEPVRTGGWRVGSTSIPFVASAGTSVPLPSVEMASLTTWAWPPAPVSSVRIVVPLPAVIATPSAMISRVR